MGLLLDMGAGPPIKGKGLNSEESPPLSKKTGRILTQIVIGMKLVRLTKIGFSKVPPVGAISS